MAVRPMCGSRVQWGDRFYAMAAGQDGRAGGRHVVPASNSCIAAAPGACRRRASPSADSGASSGLLQALH
jgi:hypothetical protein